VSLASGHLDYSRIQPQHLQFVCGTFSDAVRETPGTKSETWTLGERALTRAIRDPQAKTCVVFPAGYPDELIGWALSMPTCLVFAYVRYSHRRGRVLGHHFGIDLLTRVANLPIVDAAFDADASVPVAIWTRSASRMAARGFPIRYDLDEHEKFLQLAR